MGSESDYPYWDGWWSVAEPVNKFLPYAVLGLAVVGFIVRSLFCFIVCVFVVTAWGVIAMIFGILAGVFYLIMVMKPLKDKDLSKKMHIWLLVCTGLSWVSWWPIGILVTLQFVMVGILSDVPFWEAFSK